MQFSDFESSFSVEANIKAMKLTHNQLRCRNKFPGVCSSCVSLRIGLSLKGFTDCQTTNNCGNSVEGSRK